MLTSIFYAKFPLKVGGLYQNKVDLRLKFTQRLGRKPTAVKWPITTPLNMKTSRIWIVYYLALNNLLRNNYSASVRWIYMRW